MTVLGSVNGLSVCTPHSLPMPLPLLPPNGPIMDIWLTQFEGAYGAPGVILVSSANASPCCPISEANTVAEVGWVVRCCLTAHSYRRLREQKSGLLALWTPERSPEDLHLPAYNVRQLCYRLPEHPLGALWDGRVASRPSSKQT